MGLWRRRIQLRPDRKEVATKGNGRVSPQRGRKV